MIDIVAYAASAERASTFVRTLAISLLTSDFLPRHLKQDAAAKSQARPGEVSSAVSHSLKIPWASIVKALERASHPHPPREAGKHFFRPGLGKVEDSADN